MRVASTLAVVGFVLFVGQAQAADPAVTAAMQKLDAARSNLAKAVEKIQKDPPANADLDAANAAVEKLKEVLDAGAEFEGKDLDYAKAVLAARKEYRSQKEYVDHRRSTIQVHDMRRKMEPVVANANEKAKLLQAKEPSQKDFDDVRAALAAVKKSVEEARPLVKLDDKFGQYIAEVEATVAKHEKAIDDRWMQLSADKQRGLLDESRKDLQAAIGALGKGWTDDQFEAASAAVKALGKRLDEGKPLEGKDKAYKGEADKARAEIDKAKKRMEEAVTEAGLNRVKAELDPAYKDLQAAGKALKARNPTADQLAEAKTAAIVVRKQMEKYEAQASASKEISAYIAEVKKALVEVEVVLEQRSLESARRELLSAMKALDKREPADSAFDEAKTAMTVMEKTLESVHQKEPAIGPYVFDAKAALKDAKAQLELRRFQVDLTRHRKKVDEAKKNANTLVTNIQKEKASEAQLKEAEDAVKAIGTTLDEGAAFAKKDGEYKQYAKDTKDRMAELNDRIARRRVALSASDGRTVLSDAVSSAKAKLEAAKKPDASDADVEAASKSVDALQQELETRAALEGQDPGYASSAERARNELIKLMENLEFARQARGLRRQTGDALAAGNAAVNAAGSGSDLRKRKAEFDKAMVQFKACQEDGNRTLRGNEKLESIVVLVDGQPSKPRDVMALCATRLEATKEPMRQLEGLIRFDDGPKKAWESAKYLISSSRKAEAITQLDECVATGRIVQSRYPELKDKKFDVSGGSMTLAELIAQCSNQKKQLSK